jgi:serine/threonine protein kinase
VQVTQNGSASTGPLSSNRCLHDSLLAGTVTAKVSDFGLSKRLRPGEDRLSNIRQGTPFFMAPEVSQHHEIYPESDVYGFGVIMWEVMMGMPVCYEQCAPHADRYHALAQHARRWQGAAPNSRLSPLTPLL